MKARPGSLRTFRSSCANRHLPTTRFLPVAIASARHPNTDLTEVRALCIQIRESIDFSSSLRRWGRRYPYAGYGSWFCDWLFSEDAVPYNSFGNGSAMRVSAIGWAFNDLDVILHEAARSSAITHNHPEGIKGAQAVAAAIFVARSGQGKDKIAALLSDRFGYDCTADLRVFQQHGGLPGNVARGGGGIPPLNRFRGRCAQRCLLRW